jgi:large subunit ribosomal protein L25
MNCIKIEKRDLEKKASELRSNGYVPGTIYGPDIKSTAIKTSFMELRKATKSSGEIYKVLSSKGYIFVKINELQKDPMTNDFVHFSLVHLPREVPSPVDIPVNFKGTPIGVKKGGTFIVMKDEVTINGKPHSLPEQLIANVSNLGIGQKLTVDDLNIPKKVDAMDDEAQVIAFCSAPVKAAPLMASGIKHNHSNAIDSPIDSLSFPTQVI